MIDQHASDFSDDEKALIASMPSKPVFSADAEPMARSFRDRMQSSISDPIDHRSTPVEAQLQAEPSVEDADLIFRI